MSTVVELHKGDGIVIDQRAIMRALKLNPDDPNTQALLLVCQQYHLDPLLKHMVLISGNPYVTRDGYLAVAHASGVFDGLEVVDQGETDTHYTAKVAVYRKDMAHPFTYTGRYPKKERMAANYGPEMALKTAECAALRRAFNVTGVGAADERWDAEAEATLQEPQEMATDTQLGLIRSMLDELDEDEAKKIGEWWKDGRHFPPLASGHLTQIDATDILDYLQLFVALTDEDETEPVDVPDSGHLFTEPEDAA